MNEGTKKILVVVGFIASVIGIGAALYFAFFRAAMTPGEETPGTEETPVGSLPTSGLGGTRPIPPIVQEPGSLGDAVAQGGVTQVTTLTTGQVADITLGGDGLNANFYNPEDGRFYTIDEDGNVVQLSAAQFPQAEDVAWNAQGNEAIIEFPDGSNVVYNFETAVQVTLPKHWEDFSFAPESDEIIAKSMGLDPDNRWIVISNTDGSRVDTIQALGENADKVTISWSPNDQVIAFSNTASQISGGLDRKVILPVGKEDENFPGLVVEGLDFTPLWAPDGRRLLYSVVGDYSDNKPLLWIVDATPSTMGENRRSLGLNTWADKCTFFDASTVYCAAPQSLTSNAGLMRSLSADEPDNLYKVDLETGKTSLVAVPAESTTMESLSVTQDGGTLYFVNGNTGQLESIRLK